ncbi:MAG: hypothetical protein U9N81_01520 [Bacillota bacterium]|nr:hypothetical protein [Bacillota bacterium]
MQTIQATKVRNSFSTVVDTVVRERPVMFKRNRDNIMLMSDTQVLGLVEQCSFKATYISEDDGSTTATLDGFDLIINAGNPEQANAELASELIEYAQDYFDQFQMYYNSKNRKQHFPYIMRVLLAQDLDEVKGLIHA